MFINMHNTYIYLYLCIIIIAILHKEKKRERGIENLSDRPTGDREAQHYNQLK